MAFKTKAPSREFDLIPEGEYEVIIRNIEEKKSMTGSNTKLNFSLVVRNDVEQKFKNAYLFHEIWKKLEPNEDDKSVDNYNYDQLMQTVASVGGIPDGTEFETVQELCKVLVGKLLRVTVKHSTYNGKTTAKIDQLRGVAATKFPECRHVFKDAPVQAQQSASTINQPVSANVSEEIEILGDDDDVPF